MILVPFYRGSDKELRPAQHAYWYLGALAATPQTIAYYHLGYGCE